MLPLSESQIKQRLRTMLSRRLLLRLHVTLLFLWTVAIGALTAKGLLWLGVTSMVVRYPLAVLVGYLAFLLGVRIWLWYAGIKLEARRDDSPDAFDLPLGSGSKSSGESGAAETVMRPGGGNFGGGGASGNYTVDPALKAELNMPLRTMETGESITTAGSGADSLFQGIAVADEAAIPLALIAAILAALAVALGAGAYLIVEAPTVLVDAAFEAMLATGLIRSLRGIDGADWSKAVLRRTWLPAAVILLVSTSFSLVVAHYRPEVQTLAQLLTSL